METEQGVQQRVNAASRIFAEFGDFIFASILSNINDPATAEDVMQQFFLALVNKPVPAGIRNVKGYLYRAVYNDVVDWSRREQSYRMRCVKHVQHWRADAYVSESPEDIVSRGQEIEEMFRLIEKELPHREYQAVSERFRYDRDTEEAAKTLGVKKRSFSRYLCMGMKKVCRLFGTNGKYADVGTWS